MGAKIGEEEEKGKIGGEGQRQNENQLTKVVQLLSFP